MYPRIKSINTSKRSYQYLVISESVRDGNGRSTTKELANLGNVEKLGDSEVSNLVDGLIRLFNLDQYALAEDVEILQSLEHGSILLWRTIWQRLGLHRIVEKKAGKANRRARIDVAKYVEMMVVNRCVSPLSKLATSRWVDTTTYAAMQDYAELSRDVELFYRSMDYLLKAKDAIEAAVFRRLQNLFSINVRLTFYDITSSYFYSDTCPLAAHGYSRDKRSDLPQIVIGVLTSYEGYPLKHFVFEGNTSDGSTVAEVVHTLRQEFQIEETTFVGDRGMISKLNLDTIETESFDYIMGVKHRQDRMVPMLIEDPQLFAHDTIAWNKLKIADRRLAVSDFLRWKTAQHLGLSDADTQTPAWTAFAAFIDSLGKLETITSAAVRAHCCALGCDDRKTSAKILSTLRAYHSRCDQTLRFVCALNAENAKTAAARRAAKVSALSGQLDAILAGNEANRQLRMERVFDGHNRRFRRFFRWQHEGGDPESPVVGHLPDKAALKAEAYYDGVFVLSTSRTDLPAEKVVESYKNLQEVETLFDDLKHFVDIRPVRHWLGDRVRAHVFLCMLALLLKRVYEIDCLGSKAVTASLESIAESKLVRYQVRMSSRSEQTRTFWKVTKTTHKQAGYFSAAGIKNIESLEPYV